MLNRLSNIRRNEDYDRRLVDVSSFLILNKLVYHIKNFYISSDIEYRKDINFQVKSILAGISYPLTDYKNIQDILEKNSTKVNIIFVVNDGVVHRMVFVGEELIEEEYYGDIRRIK